MAYQEWRDPTVARAWDARGNEANPLRPYQLDALASVLACILQPGEWVIDLGYGSGKVEAFLFPRLPEVRVLGVDRSEAMMELARERLAPYADRFVSVTRDLLDLAGWHPPQARYGCVLAVQSLHHLLHEQMPGVYKWAAGVLRPGGVFALLDRVQVDAAVWEPMQALWSHMDALHDSAWAAHEGASYEEHQQRVQDRGDRPATVEQHLQWLRAAGLVPAPLYVVGNRALIVAVKKDESDSASKNG
ncbi:class I SAM-dependent methyltransferase [Alicyclobacillus kakegawensis]|uniref:class I SAM-dependent methyltransferase n=1 Tax=Alicyclobacillus kakegawensis TaxID=392012 RepID=UPI000833067D|nr:class I SAM-dependent methyltransferase [Alicyclobacillus kakegawensis]